MTCAPTKDSDQHGRLPSLFGVVTICPEKVWVLKYPKTNQTGWMSNLIWVFAGGTVHFVSFVMLPVSAPKGYSLIHLWAWGLNHSLVFTCTLERDWMLILKVEHWADWGCFHDHTFTLKYHVHNYSALCCDICNPTENFQLIFEGKNGLKQSFN